MKEAGLWASFFLIVLFRVNLTLSCLTLIEALQCAFFHEDIVLVTCTEVLV